MTEIYLIRHARALEQSSNDWERPLIPEGRAEARAVGAALKQAGVSFDVIAVSPLVRAVETATLIAVEVGYDGGLTVDASLTPDGTTNGMIGLCQHLGAQKVALVGHEPSMGQFLSDLSGRPGMSMVKAGVVHLTLAAPAARGGGKLVWQISPRKLTPQRFG